MIFKKSHKKREADTLSFQLRQNNTYIYGKKATKIFEQVIRDIEKWDFKRNHLLFSEVQIPYKKPLINGEDLGEGFPDIIYECNEYVLGIEHFEFDSGGKNRKGSKMQLAEAEANRELNAKKQGQTGNPIIEEADVKIEFSFDGYLKSLLSTYASHRDKIEKYKNHLKSQYPDKEIYFAFYMQDSTAIGNYIRTKKCVEILYPLYIKEFICEVANTQGLDFIITQIQDTYVQYLYIQEISDVTLKELYNKSYNKNEISYISYNYKKVSHTYTGKNIE